MKKHATIAATVLAAAIGTVGVNSALAQNSGSKQDHVEIRAMTSAKITLSEAIKAAESKSDDKAVEAMFSQENGKSGYEIGLMAPDGTEHTMMVDAASGAVTKMTAANENEKTEKGDHEDGADGDSEDFD